MIKSNLLLNNIFLIVFYLHLYHNNSEKINLEIANKNAIKSIEISATIAIHNFFPILFKDLE